jgi:GrpB-like predicted nucleotidyltransferase (UPF0157 family)
VDRALAAGLGLDYGTIRLNRTTEDWIIAGSQLRAGLQRSLETLIVSIEQVGSSSVLGLVAKPIIDLAVGTTAGQNLDPIIEVIKTAGWIYRGDAGDSGGHVFVLEDRPWHRVAHAHVVDHDGPQWRDYIRFRDLLRRSSDARSRYEAVKLRLSVEHPNDRKAYTEGKTDIVKELLSEIG